MALDVGSKTIGIATSDVLRGLATPLTTIRRGKLAADLAALDELATKHQTRALVVGLPLNMDGTEGPRAQSCRAFARNLERLRPVNIAFWDERLSTAAVTRTLLEADASRKRRGEVVFREHGRGNGSHQRGPSATDEGADVGPEKGGADADLFGKVSRIVRDVDRPGQLIGSRGEQLDEKRDHRKAVNVQLFRRKVRSAERESHDQKRRQKKAGEQPLCGVNPVVSDNGKRSRKQTNAK